MTKAILHNSESQKVTGLLLAADVDLESLRESGAHYLGILFSLDF